jgi:hypothetical protein
MQEVGTPGDSHPSGRSLAGSTREAWPFKLKLMLLHENAGLARIPGNHELLLHTYAERAEKGIAP